MHDSLPRKPAVGSDSASMEKSAFDLDPCLIPADAATVLVAVSIAVALPYEAVHEVDALGDREIDADVDTVAVVPPRPSAVCCACE